MGEGIQRNCIDEFKISLFQINETILTKFCAKHSWVKGIQFCKNEWQRPFSYDSKNTSTLTKNLLQVEPLDSFQPNLTQRDSSYFSSIHIKSHALFTGKTIMTKRKHIDKIYKTSSPQPRVNFNQTRHRKMHPLMQGIRLITNKEVSIIKNEMMLFLCLSTLW